MGKAVICIIYQNEKHRFQTRERSNLTLNYATVHSEPRMLTSQAKINTEIINVLRKFVE